MAISPERLATLRDIQERVASHVPSVMKLDPSNEDDAETIVLAGAIYMTVMEGGSLTLTGDDDSGRTETIEIQGTGSGGEPGMVVSIKSSDGKLGSDTAEIAAELMTRELDTELDTLLG